MIEHRCELIYAKFDVISDSYPVYELQETLVLHAESFKLVE